MNSSRENKRLTVIEIMIVLVIIVLLAAMAIPAFQKARGASKTRAARRHATQLATTCGLRGQ